MSDNGQRAITGLRGFCLTGMGLSCYFQMVNAIQTGAQDIPVPLASVGAGMSVVVTTIGLTALTYALTGPKPGQH